MDKMIDMDRSSQIYPEPQDISRLVKIKEEQLTEETWINSDPADEGVVKIEKDVTTMLVPKVEREISPSGSYEDFERDGDKGVEDEFDGISGSLKNEMSIPPLTASAKISVDIKETIENGPFSCAECKIKFKQKETLEKHKLIHSEGKPHSCMYCNETFFLRDHLNRHLKGHRMIIQFGCTICKKKFARKTGLQEHMASHSLVKLYSCTVCGTRLACRSSMYRHMATHDVDKKQPCPTCGKKFTQRGLKLHRLSHAEGKS